MNQEVFLLDFTLTDPALVQVLDELLALHPVDQWAHIATVAKEGSACQVHQTPCKDEKTECQSCEGTGPDVEGP